MNFKKIKNNNLSGFTLIEALTFIFIFSLITITFYRVFIIGTDYIIDSKNRLGAISLANERMEIARNLSYNDLGTVGGTVEGNIPQDQDITVNGRTYHVKTEVTYIQDALDGSYPADVAFEDYKKVTVIVSWGADQTGNGEVRLTSRFVTPGLEVANPNDGILSINIFSDQPGGSGIPHSSVHVINSETGLNTTLETDDSGNLMLMGDNVTQSIYEYRITVSKDGYETVSTMPPFPETSYDPTNVHASVVLGSVNVANIVQNELTDLKIRTEDGLGQAVSGVNFSLVGGKILGTENDFPYNPVYTFNSSYSTGSNGEKEFNNIGPGPFILTPSIPSEFQLICANPGNEFTLNSASPLTVTLRLASKNITSLLVTAQQDDGGVKLPVAGAQVKLTNILGYGATVTTASNGAAYFPVSSDPFLPGDYELKITAAGFQEYTSAVTINENILNTREITLTP